MHMAFTAPALKLPSALKPGGSISFENKIIDPTNIGRYVKIGLISTVAQRISVSNWQPA